MKIYTRWLLKLLKVIKNLNKKNLDLICETIKKGNVVVIPTETVYGLAADALNLIAVSKIFRVKGRPADNPLIVHVSDIEMMQNFVQDVPENALKLAEKFWPGPLTIILKKSQIVPAITTGGLDSVALRMPAHPVALEIIKSCKTGLAAPSANISGKPSPTCVAHCEKDIGDKVDIIVDGGDCDYGVESTVVSLVDEVPVILRPGVVTQEELQKVVGKVSVSKSVLNKPEPSNRVMSPGMKYRHYAPKADVILIRSDFGSFVGYVNGIVCDSCAVMVFDGEEKFVNKPCFTYGAEKDFFAQSRNLFKILRLIDEINFQKVYVRAPEPTGVGLAVYNRLIRAANFNIISINIDEQDDFN